MYLTKLKKVVEKIYNKHLKPRKQQSVRKNFTFNTKSSKFPEMNKLTSHIQIRYSKIKKSPVLMKKLQLLKRYKIILYQTKKIRYQLIAIYLNYDIFLRSYTSHSTLDLGINKLRQSMLGLQQLAVNFWTPLYTLSSAEIKKLKDIAMKPLYIKLSTTSRIESEGPPFLQWILSIWVWWCIQDMRYFVRFRYFIDKDDIEEHRSERTFLKKYLHLQKRFHHIKLIIEAPKYFMVDYDMKIGLLLYHPPGWEIPFPFRNLHLDELISHFKSIRRI